MLNKINCLLSFSKLRHIYVSSLTQQSVQSLARLSTVSNKRITRLPSDTEVSKSELSSEGNESLLNTRIVNRNPRNLEQLSLEYKPLGFELDLPERSFWNKIVFESSGKFLNAKIVHNSGRVVVSASTKELAISEQLKSTNGVNAAISLGQVLTMRALESGITQLFVGVEYESDKSMKVKSFLNCLKENGLELSEQPFIFKRKGRDP